MTLTFECVKQNWPDCANMKVGTAMLIVEPYAMGGRLIEIQRQTEEHCKVRDFMEAA